VYFVLATLFMNRSKAVFLTSPPWRSGVVKNEFPQLAPRIQSLRNKFHFLSLETAINQHPPPTAYEKGELALSSGRIA
jgi:hypothetical protein